jgi:hypothetical protein
MGNTRRRWLVVVTIAAAALGSLGVAGYYWLTEPIVSIPCTACTADQRLCASCDGELERDSRETALYRLCERLHPNEDQRARLDRCLHAAAPPGAVVTCQRRIVGRRARSGSFSPR